MTIDRRAHDDAMRALTAILTRWEAPAPAVLATELLQALTGRGWRPAPTAPPADNRDDWRPGRRPDPVAPTTEYQAARAERRRTPP